MTRNIDWRQSVINVALVLALIALAALVVAGIWYAATAPRSGAVEGAWLVPAHYNDYTTYTKVCTSYDKNMSCQSSYQVPHFHHDYTPDTCYVKINDTEKSHREATWQIACSTTTQYVPGRWMTVP